MLKGKAQVELTLEVWYVLRVQLKMLLTIMALVDLKCFVLEACYRRVRARQEVAVDLDASIVLVGVGFVSIGKAFSAAWWQGKRGV